jgi:type II restriction enzyme
VADEQAEHIRRIDALLRNLSQDQLNLIECAATDFGSPYEKMARRPSSDLADSDTFLQYFGDRLRLHHARSVQPLRQDTFEYVLVEVCTRLDKKAEKARAGNPGHDITIGGVRYSLKTQANRDIKPDVLWISKFRELGKGSWPQTLEELAAFRDRMLFGHMEGYDRILVLRCLAKGSPYWHYELVEIPKALLLEAARGRLAFAPKTTQETYPAYCNVLDDQGVLKYQLYFDAGSERKLQVRSLRKSYCILHAEWIF